MKGMLFGMPDAFMRSKAKEAFGIELPPTGEYAVANVFFPPENPEVLQDCKATMERLTRQRGLNVLGWRPVPVDNSMLGQDPLDSEPVTEQVRTSSCTGLGLAYPDHVSSHLNRNSSSLETMPRRSYPLVTSSVNFFAFARWPRRRRLLCSGLSLGFTSTRSRRRQSHTRANSPRSKCPSTTWTSKTRPSSHTCPSSIRGSRRILFQAGREPNLYA